MKRKYLVFGLIGATCAVLVLPVVLFSLNCSASAEAGANVWTAAAPIELASAANTADF